MSTTFLENERQAPQSIETERTILGAILLDGDLVHEALSILRPEHFFLSANRLIFQVLEDLAGKDVPIDAVTVANVLSQKRQLEQVGGLSYLSQLKVGVPRMPSIKHYCDTVKEKANLRSIIAAANNAASMAADSESSSEVIARLEGDLLDLVEDRTKTRTLPQIASDFLTNLQTLREQPRNTTLGLSYGIESLDRFTTGIREADYTLIAGRSGNGKSALVRRIARENAKAGHPVAVFTPEVTGEQFFSMLVPLESHLPFFKVRDPRMLSREDLSEVQNVTDQIMQWPLWIDDTSGITISELVAKAKLQIAKGARLVIVDYLQLVQAPGTKTERDRVNEISGGLRHLAKSTKVPVIALSQLARPNDRNPNERPTMFHLKESGNLEQDAFNILLLFRPVDDNGFTGQDEIIIAKQRFGEAGTFVPVTFDKHRVTYVERPQ
jgi:replicative DNA helicase